MSARGGLAVFVAALAMGALGCEVELEPVAYSAACGPYCPCIVADPYERCISVLGCRPERDECPSGSTCVFQTGFHSPNPPPPRDPYASCVSPWFGDLKPVCRVIPTAGETDGDPSLVNGFRGPGFGGQFDLVRVPGRPAQFTWTAPPNARVVACALFGCKPVIDGEIVNADRCILSRAKTFTTADQSYLPELRPRGRATSVVQSCASETTEDLRLDRSKLTQLGVGCWAYDDTRVIGATPIRAIPLDEADDYPGLFRTCHGIGGDEGADCVRAIPGGGAEIGTCAQGECLSRCVTARDCRDDGTTRCGSSCDHYAGSPDYSYVGVCRLACDHGE